MTLDDELKSLRKRLISSDGEIVAKAEKKIQWLRNDLETLRAAHFEQNERLTRRTTELHDALLAVVREVLPPHATPSAMRNWGAPWPQVSNALWPEQEAK